jgi:hypothetical protein
MASDVKGGLSLSVQATLLFISIILFVIYYFHLFREDKHNKLALAFAVVTFLWFITVVYRYWCREWEVKQVKHMPIIDVPYEIKCTIGDENCENGDITTWTIGHFIIYMIVGLYIPNCYLEILIISIICEMLESALGHTSKFVIDPLINLTGYAIGSAFSRKCTELCGEGLAVCRLN